MTSWIMSFVGGKVFLAFGFLVPELIPLLLAYGWQIRASRTSSNWCASGVCGGQKLCLGLH